MIKTPRTGITMMEASLIKLASLVLFAKGNLVPKPSRKRPETPVPASKLRNFKKLRPFGRTVKTHRSLSIVPWRVAARKTPCRPDRALRMKITSLLAEVTHRTPDGRAPLDE